MLTSNAVCGCSYVAKSSNDTIINTAEITKDTDADGNEIEDIDSTPNNKKPGEDDIDQAPWKNYGY